MDVSVNIPFRAFVHDDHEMWKSLDGT